MFCPSLKFDKLIIVSGLIRLLFFTCISFILKIGETKEKTTPPIIINNSVKNSLTPTFWQVPC